jgi:hypothetical protein
MRRDIHLYRAIFVHSDVLEPRQVVNACLFEVLDHSYQHLSQIGWPYLVKEAHVLIGVLNKILETVVDEFVVEGVVGAVP